MNRNRWLGCLAALVGLALSACGADPADSLSSSTQAMQEKAAVKGVWFCDFPVPPGPVNLPDVIFQTETDRPYMTARPGFENMWLAIGFDQRGLIAEMVGLFDDVPAAQAFDGFVNDQFVLGGVHFWDRPDFRDGHQCRVMELLGSLERPETKASQPMIRTEHFSIDPSSGDPRELLKGWFGAVKAEASRRNINSLYLMYSEAAQTATLMYLEDLPAQDRDLMTLPPIIFEPPLAQGATADASGWNLAIYFPFEAGDHGKPSAWPIPAVHPGEGDGVCEVSRHESFHTTTDCVETCGNAVWDEGETWQTCPGDVNLFPL